MHIRFVPQSKDKNKMLAIFEFKDETEFIIDCTLLQLYISRNSKIVREKETNSTVGALDFLLSCLLSRCNKKYRNNDYEYSAMLFQDEFTSVISALATGFLLSETKNQSYENNAVCHVTDNYRLTQKNVLQRWLMYQFSDSSSPSCFKYLERFINTRLEEYNINPVADFEFGNFIDEPNKQGVFSVGHMFFIYESDEHNVKTISGPFCKNDIIGATVQKLHISKYFDDYKLSKDAKNIYKNTNYRSIGEIVDSLHSENLQMELALVKNILAKINEKTSLENNNVFTTLKSKYEIIKKQLIEGEPILENIDKLTYMYMDTIPLDEYKMNDLLVQYLTAFKNTYISDNKMVQNFRDVFGDSIC